MSDSLIKRIEIRSRRFLIHLLSRLIHRSTPLPSHIEYNSCKFLFVRQDRIGDVLISTPLFSAIKKHYPSAIIDVMLSNKNHFVLAHDPIIRKRWVYKKTLISALRMLHEIRHEQYDFVIDLMDNPSATSTCLCAFSGARWTVGIEKDNAFVYDIRVPMLSRRDNNIHDRIGCLLKPFGIDVSKENFGIRYFTSEESRKNAENFLLLCHLQEKEIVGVNISAGSEIRFWGVENYRQLVQKLIRKYPSCTPIIIYKPSHHEYAKMIASQIDGCVLSPLTKSFDEFAAFVQRCSFLITPDTSAVHLAAAFGIPVVVLYVQSNKELHIWNPQGVDYEALIADVDDLKVIPVDDVFMAFDALYHRSIDSRK